MTENRYEKIYSDTISILEILEVSIEDQKMFSFVRKKILDIANDVKRLGEENGSELNN
jgi:hypothetical protein